MAQATAARWRAIYVAALHAGCKALEIGAPPAIPSIRERTAERVAHLHDSEQNRLLAAYSPTPPALPCFSPTVAYGRRKRSSALACKRIWAAFQHLVDHVCCRRRFLCGRGADRAADAAHDRLHRLSIGQRLTMACELVRIADCRTAPADGAGFHASRGLRREKPCDGCRCSWQRLPVARGAPGGEDPPVGAVCAACGQ
jgi:hypothetical protein